MKQNKRQSGGPSKSSSIMKQSSSLAIKRSSESKSETDVDRIAEEEKTDEQEETDYFCRDCQMSFPRF